MASDDDDENQIRELVQTWMHASQAGDVDTVLGLVTDDVVFLVPGRPPMRKPEFVEQSRAQAAPSGITIEGKSDIQEVKVMGDWAFMWTKLFIAATPAGKDGERVERAGHTLTVLKKEDGKWRIARDANVMVEVGKRN